MKSKTIKSTSITRRKFLSVASNTTGAIMLMNQHPTFADQSHDNPLKSHSPQNRRDVTFKSVGAELSGWLYEPAVNPPWPIVVMAHGFTATRKMTADKYAEVFCEHGMAVLLYDHRGFGDSSGEPRRQINLWIQACGYVDAISFVKKQKVINPKQIAIWGDSASGGVALVAASIIPGIAALVIQVPALGSSLPPKDTTGTLFQKLKKSILFEPFKLLENVETEGPMPVVSDDQYRRPSALHPLTAYRWFIEYGGRFDTGWVNDVTRAKPKSPIWHPGLCAEHISCPCLFMVSPNDEMKGASPAVARSIYNRIKTKKKWMEIEGGHFGLVYFPSAEFEKAAFAQAEFLSDNLIPVH